MECGEKPAEGVVADRFFELAFPDGYDAPAHVAQGDSVFKVACAVAVYFIEPKLPVGPRKRFLAFVPVPETSVYENDSMEPGKDDVGGSGQTFAVQPISETVAPQETAHNHFRLRVVCSNPAHAAVSLLCCHTVAHLSGLQWILRLQR